VRLQRLNCIIDQVCVRNAEMPKVVQTEGDEPAEELPSGNNGSNGQIRVPHGGHRFPHGCVEDVNGANWGMGYTGLK